MEEISENIHTPFVSSSAPEKKRKLSQKLEHAWRGFLIAAVVSLPACATDPTIEATRQAANEHNRRVTEIMSGSGAGQLNTIPSSGEVVVSSSNPRPAQPEVSPNTEPLSENDLGIGYDKSVYRLYIGGGRYVDHGTGSIWKARYLGEHESGDLIYNVTFLTAHHVGDGIDTDFSTRDNLIPESEVSIEFETGDPINHMEGAPVQMSGDSVNDVLLIRSSFLIPKSRVHEVNQIGANNVSDTGLSDGQTCRYVGYSNDTQEYTQPFAETQGRMEETANIFVNNGNYIFNSTTMQGGMSGTTLVDSSDRIVGICQQSIQNLTTGQRGLCVATSINKAYLQNLERGLDH